MRWGMAWLALVALGFGGGAAMLVISRLSDQQLALLAGAVCGSILALPLGAAIGAYGWSQRGTVRRAAPSDRPAAPPVIYVTTASAPPAVIEAAEPAKSIEVVDRSPLSRRAFSVIGGDELDEV